MVLAERARVQPAWSLRSELRCIMALRAGQLPRRRLLWLTHSGENRSEPATAGLPGEGATLQVSQR
jgi:hypothetical protein